MLSRIRRTKGALLPGCVRCQRRSAWRGAATGATVVLSAVLAVVRPAPAQGFDSERFPDPISTDALVEWFGPVLGDGDAWGRVLTLHQEYLRQQRDLRELEVEPWLRRADAAATSPSAPPGAAFQRALDRGRDALRGRLSALDDAFLAGVAAALDERVAPMAEWLRVRRTLASCECGLDEQTQDVSFSLLSYSELALGAPSVLWAAPEAAKAFAAYDAQVMRLGKAFMRERRALDEALEDFDADAEAHEPSELEPPLEPELEPELELGGDDVEISPHDDGPAGRLERLGLRQTRRLAVVGRRSLASFEAALPPRARLLLRLRLIASVVRVAESEEDPSGGPTFRGALVSLRRLLERTIDPRVGERVDEAIDLDAIDALAALHWEQSEAISGQMIAATRRASDVRFAEGREPTEEELRGDQARLLELAQRWKPLLVETAALLGDLLEQGHRVAAGPGATLVLSQPMESVIVLPARPSGGWRPEPVRPAAPSGGDASMERGAWLLALGTDRPGPVTVERVVDSLGCDAADEASPAVQIELHALASTIREEAMASAWPDLAPLVDAWDLALREAKQRPSGALEAPPDEDSADVRLIEELRRAVGRVDATIVGELEQLVVEPEHRLRLRLLGLSTALKSSSRRVATNEGALKIAAGPVDLADLALQVLFGCGAWSTMFAGHDELVAGSASPPAPGPAIAGPLDEPAQARRRQVATALLDAGPELLAAAERTGAALVQLAAATPAATRTNGRFAEVFQYDRAVRQRRGTRPGPSDHLLAAREQVVAAVRMQVELEAQVLEAMQQAADGEPQLAESLGRAALRASVRPISAALEDVGEGLRLERAMIVAARDERLAVAAEAVSRGRRAPFEAIEDALRRAAMELGVVVDDFDRPATKRWQRVLARAEFDAAEANASALLQLARSSSGEAGAPLAAELGLHGAVGRRLERAKVAEADDGRADRARSQRVSRDGGDRRGDPPR